MSSRSGLAPLLLGLLCYASSGLADSDKPLEEKLQALEARVAELEQRLNALETPEVRQLVRELSAPQNPGDSTERSNWARLKVGYDYAEVRELLGEPRQVKKGGMEFWYYSERGLQGPYVKFLFRKVNDWRGPKE